MVTRMPTNADRAEWAEQALEAFCEATGSDPEDRVSDLLADLMHLCNIDEDCGTFDAELDRARRHYDAEIQLGGEE